MLLRNVELGDVEAYVRMRRDPVMMAELGGPLPREGIKAKVARDVAGRVERDGRWGLVHAFPGATNAASDGVCRKLGFTLLGEQEVEFAGRMLKTDHWAIRI